MQTERMMLVPDFNETEKPEDLFAKRVLIEAAMDRLKALKSALDVCLMSSMVENRIEQFETSYKSEQYICKLGKKKQETVSADKLVDMLKDSTTRGMALGALSGGQSAWKKAEVRTIQDTLGRTDLYYCKWENEIELKLMPKKLLNGGGK